MLIYWADAYTLHSGCKRKVWFGEDLCGDFTMVGDEGADIAGGRVCQNIDTNSPFSWFGAAPE
jgi:hypothetical protein